MFEVYDGHCLDTTNSFMWKDVCELYTNCDDVCKENTIRKAMFLSLDGGNSMHMGLYVKYIKYFLLDYG